MMSDQDTNLFEQKEDSQQAAPDQSAKQEPSQGIDLNAAFADQLASIKNEKGEPKYSTVEDALKALNASQEHIRTLEQENNGLREVSNKVKTTDEILAILNSNKNKDPDDNQNQINVETIKELVNATLTEKQQRDLQLANQAKVREELVKKFGEKTKETYLNKAKELDLSPSMLDQLAATSPRAVLEYFNVKQGPAPTKNTQSSVSTEHFQGTPNPQPKKVMYGASSADMVEAWKQAVSSVATS